MKMMHKFIIYNLVEILLLEISRLFVPWPYCYMLYAISFSIWAYWMYTDVVKSVKGVISGNSQVTNIQELNILSSIHHNLDTEIEEYAVLFSTEARKSERDNLTDLYNKQHEESVMSIYRTCKELFIMILDVNNLKKMNDINGHIAGDGLIKSAARALTAWKTSGDVYRIGGDEFMIVVMNKPLSVCESLVNEWATRTGRLNRATDDFICDFAWGYAFSERPINYADLKQQADERMYVHKKAIKEGRGEAMR